MSITFLLSKIDFIFNYMVVCVYVDMSMLSTVPREVRKGEWICWVRSICGCEWLNVDTGSSES